MGVLLLAAVLAAAPVKVATSNWTFSGVEPAVGEAFLDRFASQLAERGVQVTTQRDIQQVLGLERQKQLTGCSDGSSCLAELAGALGVDAVLTGTVVKVGTAFTVTLRAIAAGTGKQLATATERLKSEDAVQDWLDQQARAMPGRITDALAPEPAAGVGTSSSPPSLLTRLSPAIAGLLLFAGGGICFGLSRTEATALMTPGALTMEREIAGAASRGELLEKVGVALMIVGVAAAVAGALWLFLGGSR